MSQVFPAQRNYRFSSGLMNLKFMQRASTTDEKTSIAERELSRPKQQAPALTLFEANRREMEMRMQSSDCVTVVEENSVTRLYDLVSGHFNFRISFDSPVAAAPQQNSHDDDEDMEDGEVDADGAGGRERGQRKRKSDQPDDRNPKGQKTDDDSSATSKMQNGRYFTSYTKNKAHQKKSSRSGKGNLNNQRFQRKNRGRGSAGRR